MKLKYIRNGHKSAAARLIDRFEEIHQMDTEDVNFNEVTQIAESLENRVKVIEEINNKILDELKEEHEIEAEICEAAEYSLKTQVTIQNIKNFANSTASNFNRNSNQASSLTNATQTHSLTVQDESDHRNTSSTQMEMRSPELNLPQSTTFSSSSYSKLPKLELPKFDGDIMQWNAFWDSYESAVHENQTLTNAQKFNYLKSLLKHEPLQTVSGFSLTNTNYEKAIELLHERYGQKDRIIQTYMQTLLDLPAPSNSADSLREFHDKLEIYIRGLESLGQSESTYGSLLVTVVMNKLPADVRQNLIRDHGSSSWTLNELRKGLRKELHILEIGKPIGNAANFIPTATFLARSETSKSVATSKQGKFSKPAQNTKTCIFCKGPHYAAECKSYSDYAARIAIVKREKLCFNCLGHHRIVDCKSKGKCRTCNRKHHSSLCKDALVATSESQSNNSRGTRTSGAQNHNANNSGTSVLHSSFSLPQGQVLLKTAIAPVSSQSTSVDANILFDEGAQRSFVTEKMADILKLSRTGRETLQISGFGENAQRVRHLDTAVIHIQTENEEIPLNVLIVPEIAAPIHTYKLTPQNSTHLTRLKLAHPFMEEGQFKISVLVGADYYWNIVQDNVVRGNGPTAVQSKLGYLLSGPTRGYASTPSVPTPSPTSTSMMHILTSHEREEVDLEKFWEIETLGIDKREVTDDNYMLQYQKSSISYREGKYHAKLPWKDEHSELPTNETVARQRTLSVINRLRKDPEVLQIYGDIIADQETRGFIEKVSNENDGTKIHYIPHHAVKKDSSTTPIRIVFDCSCKASPDSPSLNECLNDTPPSLNEITSILLRFRSQRYACTTDIEKAFLNIGLEEEDRDATRFFWLSDPTNPDSDLEVYRFKSVLFGATCSPFILSATILKHLDINKCEFTETLLNDLYVDNIISSFADESRMLQYFETSRYLFNKANFNLRSWASNSSALQELATKLNVCDKDEITKVLGMRWNPETDTISFVSKDALNKSQPDLTKREVLRQSSVIYDPLGVLSPITVRAKVFMQLLWKQNTDWDQTLPENLKGEWNAIRLDLIKSTKTEIPRFYFATTSNTEERTLHVFTDASQKAYGACAYIVTGAQSSLVMSRNRVAPLKPISIPRLELSGAVVGARLCDHILSNVKCSRVFLWSDSMIVLSWLKSTKKQPVFVANRVKEIKELTNTFEWRYCPTKSNPADMLSRGISADQFINCDLWMQGPQWITEEEKWPSIMHADETMATIDENNQTNIHVNTVRENPPGIENIVDIDRFASYGKLIRTTAYVLRFVNSCRNRDRNSGPLTPSEINTASLTWIKCVQQSNYAEVIQTIEGKSKTVHTLVKQLSLFADENRVLRCRGRIHNAPLELSVRFPFLLPPKTKLTDLIIMDAHVETLHAGVESTVTYLRQRFWIPTIRQRVKTIIHNCVKCKKVLGKPYRTPDPPPLPKDRLREAPPFTVTGVDFSGALHVRNKNGNTDKVYICLFTCANTRAVHLEIVPNLTEDSFLLAFKRFVARKSVPQIMISDNALTFSAAAKSLESLQQRVALCGTVWKFIPQRAPWYGGWWERLIGLTKTTIRKVLGKACVSLELLQTLIVEVECILNNRPLTHVSSDPLDQDPLTPAHLLYGRAITCLAYPADRIDEYSTDITHQSVNKLSNLQSQIIQHFWSRWKKEYLTSLREYHRSHGREGQDVNVGDVVLVHDETPRVNWPLGVIEDVTTGGDGFTRAARVRTRRGVLCRPVAKLYPLEIQDKL